MVAHYYAELVSFFARSLNSRDAAADVVQESYARVFAMQSQDLAIRDLRALLFRTGKNIVIDDARRRQVDAQVLDHPQPVGGEERRDQGQRRGEAALVHGLILTSTTPPWRKTVSTLASAGRRSARVRASWPGCGSALTVTAWR